MNLDKIKVRVSKKDGNLLAQMILVEFILRSINNLVDKKSDSFQHKRLPKDKEDFYNAIKEFSLNTVETVTAFNNKVQDEYLKIYTKKDFNILVESVVAIIEFMEAEDPEKIVKLMKELGFKGTDSFWVKREVKKWV